MKSCTLYWDSSSPMCLLTAGCEMKSRSAVRVKLSVRAAVMKTLSRKSSITFQINETASFAAIGGIYGRNSGARRPENREPQAAAASAPEPQRPQGSGKSDTAGPGSHAAKIGRRKSPQRRSTAKIRCGTHRKTVDSRNRTGKSRCKRRSAAKNPAQKPPQND